MTSNNHHKWLTLAAAVCANVIVFGTNHGFGALFTPLLDTFGRSRSLTATVHAILRGLTGILGIFSGLLTAKLGASKSFFLGGTLLSVGFSTSYFATSVEGLCVTIGVLGGVGSSLLVNACATSTGQSFSGPQRTLAIGILNSGNSIGGVLFPILFTFLVTQFGLKGTFLVAGAISLNTLPAAFICAFDRSNVGAKHTSSADSAKAESIIGEKALPVSADTGCCKRNFLKWLNGTVLLVINGTAVSFAATITFMGLVLDVFISKGSSQEAGVTCLSVISLMSLASRLFLALTKRFCDDSWAIPQLVSYCVLEAVGTLLITLFNSSEVMLVGAGLIGIAYGGLLVTGMTFVMDNVPRLHIPVATGVLHSWIGINTVITGPFFGAIYDWTSSYQSVLIVIVCLHILSCMSFLAAMVVRRYGRKDETKEPVNVEATYYAVEKATDL